MSINTCIINKTPPLLMGIVNITPDSFSDGGNYFDADQAINKAIELIEDGAHIIDLGAESTRPLALPVTPQEEWKRLAPVLSQLSLLKDHKSFKISIDTRHDETILKALAYPIDYINNVSGLADKQTLHEINRHSVSYIAMHMYKIPENMQLSPLSGLEALNTVSEFFVNSYQFLSACGFSHQRIWLDPGIGFGKDDRANLALLANIPAFSSKYQITIGVSRKSMFKRLLDLEKPESRDPVSKVTEFACWLSGAKMLRTHSVFSLAQMISLLQDQQNNDSLGV